MWESSFVFLLYTRFLENRLRVVRQNRFALCQSMQIALRDTTRIRFGKAGAHPQLAWETAIAPETLYLITAFLFQKAIAVSAILS